MIKNLKKKIYNTYISDKLNNISDNEDKSLGSDSKVYNYKMGLSGSKTLDRENMSSF